MNKTLGVTISDLKQSLQKALLSSGLNEQLRIKALMVGDDIVEVNRKRFPKIDATISKTGTWSWAISFTSPGLWSGVFGTQFKAGNEFDTQTFSSGISRGGAV